MAAQNRVTPAGTIVAIEQRGLFMGNRGSIHRGPGEIARPWQVRRWITCRLEYKGWVAPKWVPGRWTPLFFWDEAVALAAGHRPCALCRRADFDRWCDAWESAFGERLRADPMDRVMHDDRVDVGRERLRVDPMDRVMHDDRVDVSRTQRRHRRPWAEVPAGAFVLVDDVPSLVLADRLVPWSPAGYGPPEDRPAAGDALVMTPACTVEVLRHYEPVVHP